MMFRRQWRNYVIALTATKIETTVGLNSILNDGNHILMWETDKADYQQFYTDLANLQHNFGLPSIYIFKSSVNGGFHAFCLDRSLWRTSISMASMISTVDMKWIQACVSRGYFTIRIGLKHDREPIPITILPSKVEATVKIDELVNYDRYEIHASR